MEKCWNWQTKGTEKETENSLASLASLGEMKECQMELSTQENCERRKQIHTYGGGITKYTDLYPCNYATTASIHYGESLLHL